jgi:hypothetical protein
MAFEPIEAIEHRDRAMQKLQDLTWACFLWAAGMVAMFSVIAAATAPGQSQGAPSSSTGSETSSSSSASTFTDDGQLQAPANGSFQTAGGRPALVVSGGSH